MKVEKITEDEAALYDRQIRLWGVDAQKKLLNSRVLLINSNGLCAEIAKNLVLSGIKSLTILDSNNICENDLRLNFILNKTAIGTNKAQSCVDYLQMLNPMVKVTADCESVEQKPDSYFHLDNFDLVCALFYDDNGQLLRLNEICRINNVHFICGYVFGIYGFMFVDLNKFNYICTIPKITDDSNSNKDDLKLNSAQQKLEFIEKEKLFISYAEFLKSYSNVINGISEKKLKRISKTYFVVILMRHFYDKFKRNINLNEDKENFIELKNNFFIQNGIKNESLIETNIIESIHDESPAVNAILGGIIAQEIIKILSKKNEPIDNLFLFDGETMSGVVEKIGY